MSIIQKVQRGLLELYLFGDFQFFRMNQPRDIDLRVLKTETLNYVEQLRIKTDPYGQYFYSSSSEVPLLYASTYAALTRHIFNDLTTITEQQKKDWREYILSFQCEDGLFRDPAITNDLAESGDWWGWRHLTVHCLMAITALGGIAENKIELVNRFSDLDQLENWFNELDWGEKVDFSSNAIQNIGVLLQYARDFHHNVKAGQAINFLFKLLDAKQNTETGLWGNYPTTNRILSTSVQAAYHILLLYFYDKRNINYLEQIFRFTKKTQNMLGGFSYRFSSSACDDIDSIDILIRLAQAQPHRKEELTKPLQKALIWIMYNRNLDGGYVFRRASDFEYGHPLMFTKKDQSSLFATWFRTLSISYIYSFLEIPNPFKVDLRCPGYQFWRN